MNRLLASVLFLAAALAAALLVWRGGGGGSALNLQFGKLSVQVISPTLFRFDIDGASKELPRLLDLKAQRVEGARRTDTGFETPAIAVKVDSERLCFDVYDKSAGISLAEVCANPQEHTLNLNAPLMTHAYGLGEQMSSSPNQSWTGQIRKPGDKMGNMMEGFENAMTGNAQFPILYALGEGKRNFALIYDNVFPQTWNFQNQPWTASAPNGPVRGYFFAGRDLPDLRRQFMAVSGRPPVPPAKAFGLWISEYGFDNWRELEGKVNSLRASGFPIEGAVLDLQWFGNITKGSEMSGMGALEWDLNNFPDPKGKIAELKAQGIGLMAIEEPFIARKVLDRRANKPIFEILEKKGFLAREGNAPDAPPVALDPEGWWGNGGMMDFVQAEAADFWHDYKRQPLIEVGLIGHWTDLGEPEMYSEGAYYDKGRYAHAEIHNIYNLRWSESVWRGYQRNKVEQRPWIMSRSGTIGSQRYGVGMWSGDIGSNMQSLAATVRAHSHMSLSGIDYFGSDAGGFHRTALKGGNLSEMYTQWFAASALFDVPVRPHTLNLCNCNETAPDKIGHKESNLFHMKLRAALLPYYYSLAHEAQRAGEAFISPLVYHFQEDAQTRDISDQKMIGPYLMAASVAKDNVQARDVYFPAGQWVDFHSGEAIQSRGQWARNVKVRHSGRLQLPLYAREGAIVPMHGEHGELNFRIFPSKDVSTFNLYEDDGRTNAYLRGERRLTQIRTQQSEDGIDIIVGRPQGTFKGAEARRTLYLDVYSQSRPVAVMVGEEPLESQYWSYQNKRARVRLDGVPADEARQVRLVFQ